MSKNGGFELLEQVNSLNKKEEEILAICFYSFEPYRKELEKQMNNLKGIKEPLQGFTPSGNKKETHETFRFTYNRISSALLSLGIVKRNLNLDVAKVVVPFIVSSDNVSINGLERFKEPKEDLLGIASKLSVVTELLQTQICREDREENREVFWVIHKQLKIVVADLCWLAEELNKCMNEVINSFVTSKAV